MATTENKVVESTKKNPLINTDLKAEIIGVSIHRIKLIEKDGNKFFMMDCTNLLTRTPMTMSATPTQVAAFELEHVIREGNFNTETERPLYLNVETVYVPNDGTIYGYVTKDGETKPYNSKGGHIFRNIKGTLNSDVIRNAEAGVYAGSYQTHGFIEEAKEIFRFQKGREYRPNVSTDDDTEFMILYRAAKSSIR